MLCTSKNNSLCCLAARGVNEFVFSLLTEVQRVCYGPLNCFTFSHSLPRTLCSRLNRPMKLSPQIRAALSCCGSPDTLANLWRARGAMNVPVGYNHQEDKSQVSSMERYVCWQRCFTDWGQDFTVEESNKSSLSSARRQKKKPPAGKKQNTEQGGRT